MQVCVGPWDITVRTRLTESGQHARSQGKFDVGAIPEVTIRHRYRVALDLYWEPIMTLRNLFAICAGRPVWPTSVRADMSHGPVTVHDPRLHAYTPLATPDLQLVRRMTAVFPNLSDRTYQWFKAAQRTRAAQELFFGVLCTEDSMFNELRTLSLAMAAEVFHAHVYGGQWMSDREYEALVYKPLVAALPVNLDPDWRNSLKMGGLKYQNRFSLRRRLADLVKAVHAAEISPDLERNFSGWVTDIRNRLTHDGPFATDADVTWTEVWRAGEQLKGLLAIHLLLDAGFDATEIGLVVVENPAYLRDV